MVMGILVYLNKVKFFIATRSVDRVNLAKVENFRNGHLKTEENGDGREVVVMGK